MVEVSLELFDRMEVLRCQADHLVNTAAGLYNGNGAPTYYGISMKHQCAETVGLNVAGRMYAESCTMTRFKLGAKVILFKFESGLGAFSTIG